MCEAMPLKQSELLQFEGNKEKYELLQFEGNHTLHRLAHGDEKNPKMLYSTKRSMEHHLQLLPGH